jgi:membrane-associated phospholipid phosphatase
MWRQLIDQVSHSSRIVQPTGRRAVPIGGRAIAAAGTGDWVGRYPLLKETTVTGLYPRITAAALGLLVLGLPSALAAQQQVVHRSDTIVNVSKEAVLISAGIVGVAFLFDKKTANTFEGYYGPATASTANTFNKFGEITGIGVVVGGLGVASLITRDHHTVQTLLRVTTGVVVASAISSALKYAVGRERPYADADHDGLDFHPFQGVSAGSPSFPSGHTTIAFALATSLGDAVGNNWVKAGLWGLATGTAWARLQLDQHWLSDVAVGAAIGIMSAKYGDGRIKILGIRPPRFVMPERGTFGLAWTLPAPVVR